jgi:hypothetical protein
LVARALRRMLLARRPLMDRERRAHRPSIGLLLMALLHSAACGNTGAPANGGSSGAAGSLGDGSGGSAGASQGDASPTDGNSSLDAIRADVSNDAPRSVCGGQQCAAATTACCSNCQGGFSCSLIGAFCPAVQCPPPAPDGGSDASGAPLVCGTVTCGAQQACVHPAAGGTCVMPDAGLCPAGTSNMLGCCVPPDHPSCVTIDRPCNTSSVTCGCFSVDPCDPSSNACPGALIQGRDIRCRAG